MLCKTISVNLLTKKHETDWSHPLLILKYPKAMNDVAHCARRKTAILNFIRYIICSTRLWNCHFVWLIRGPEVGGHNAQKNFFFVCYVSNRQPNFFPFPHRDFLHLDTLVKPLLSTFEFLLVFLRVFLSIPIILNTIIFIQLVSRQHRLNSFFLGTWLLEPFV